MVFTIINNIKLFGLLFQDPPIVNVIVQNLIFGDIVLLVSPIVLILNDIFSFESSFGIVSLLIQEL